MKLMGKGFRFGILLQIAIGPVFVFVLKTAVQSGHGAALAAALAATLVDAVFVSLAIFGIGKVLEKPGIQGALKVFGTIILVYFGIGIILGSFGIQIIPGFGKLLQKVAVTNAFLYGFILTASSPLTILFWTGVFATKLSDENYSKGDMMLFGVGAVMTTLVSLGLVAMVGGRFESVLSLEVMMWLNILVGVILIGFAIRMIFHRSAQVTQHEVVVVPSELPGSK